MYNGERSNSIKCTHYFLKSFTCGCVVVVVVIDSFLSDWPP